MTRWGLGRAGWAAVAVMTVLNIYAILPLATGLALVGYSLAIVAIAYCWIRLLALVWSWLFASGPAAEPVA